MGFGRVTTGATALEINRAQHAAAVAAATDAASKSGAFSAVSPTASSPSFTDTGTKPPEPSLDVMPTTDSKLIPTAKAGSSGIPWGKLAIGAGVLSALYFVYKKFRGR